VRSIGTESVVACRADLTLGDCSARRGGGPIRENTAEPGEYDILEREDIIEPRRAVTATWADPFPAEGSESSEGPHHPNRTRDERARASGIPDSSFTLRSLENELLRSEVSRLRERLYLYARGRPVQEMMRIIGELGGWADQEPFEAALWRAIDGDKSRARTLRLSDSETAFLRELRDDSDSWISVER
jgi:hypothetical protein